VPLCTASVHSIKGMHSSRIELITTAIIKVKLFMQGTVRNDIDIKKINRTTAIEDCELLENIKSDQPGAFKLLVEKYQEKVLNTCYRFLNNREDAEDVAQDIFVEAYQSISRFRVNSKISTWIFRIAVIKLLDALRKKRRKKRLAQIQSIFGQKEDNEQFLIPDCNDPVKELENQERAAILQQAINSLSENQQIAITLNKCEGFSQKEVAEIMGTSVSAVDALIQRAKKNLQVN
jgi:RNA polymerase sigma-70 factor (ECF subfamily)